MARSRWLTAAMLLLCLAASVPVARSQEQGAEGAGDGGVAVAAAAAPSSAPRLFAEPDGEVNAASATSLLAANLPTDVEVVRIRVASSDGGARQPNAKLVAIQASLLASAPAVMTLDLPGVAPVTITQRADLMDSRAPVPAAAAAAPGGNASEAVDSGSTWVGEVASSPGPASVVTLTTVTASGGAVFGNVRYYDAKAKRMRTFRIAPVVKGRAGAASAGTLSPEFDAGKSVVVEYREPNLPRKMAVPTAEQLAAATAAAAPANASAPPSSPAADASAPVPPSPSPALADGGGRRRLQQSGNVRQDLLAVFTSSAAAASNGVEGIKATIRNTVAATNKAYADSGIGVTLNLVDIRMVDYSESGRSDGTVFDDLTKGNIPNVRAWRDQLGADMVALFNQATGSCGIGWVMQGKVADLAYATVNRGCFATYTLAHELGHLQGCGHDADDLKQNPRAGDALWAPWAWGWRRCDLGAGNFKTILSYGCNGAVELGAFATPSRIYRNTPIGDANRGHCARAIQESAATVAAFRQGGAPPPLPPPTGAAAPIVARLNSLCVDAPNWSSGTQLYMWSCHGGGNQQLEMGADGSLRFAGNRNKCIDVSNGADRDGTAVQVWDCNGTRAQRWFRDSLGRLHPYAAPTRCLDIPNANAAQGTRLAIWDCNTSAAQQFSSPAGWCGN